jgi:hypothetical protein
MRGLTGSLILNGASQIVPRCNVADIFDIEINNAAVLAASRQRVGFGDAPRSTLHPCRGFDDASRCRRSTTSTGMINPADRSAEGRRLGGVRSAIGANSHFSRLQHAICH